MSRFITLPAKDSRELNEREKGKITNALRIAAEYFETAARDATAAIPAAERAEKENPEAMALITANGYRQSAAMFEAEAKGYRDLLALLSADDDKGEEDDPDILIRRWPAGSE